MSLRFRPPRDVPFIGKERHEQMRFRAWLRSAFMEIADDLAAIGRVDTPTRIEQETIDVPAGALRRVTPPIGGMAVRVPAPTPGNIGQSIRLMIESPVGELTVESSPGKGDDGKIFQPTINGQSRATFTASGLVTLTSNGFSDWKTASEFAAEAVASTRSSAALNAEYLLSSASALLPRARVADDSTEIDLDYVAPGIVSWFLKTASVGFAKLADLTGLSVLGRATNSAGVMAAITATAARQTLRANDAGAALEWGHPVEVRDSGADQGDAYALDFVAGTNVNLAASVTGGVATLTPSVDLSSVTYTAGDGIDLAANQFSADVSDFAGTGIEDDGSNNLRIAAAAAGAGLTGGGGSALAVGAGTGITVNANDVAWSGVTVRSTSSGNLTRRAIRLIENSVYTWALVDDAGNDEVEVTLQLNAVPFSSLATLAGLSVLGRSANSTGTMAAITASSARQALRVNDAGTALEWGHPVEIRNNANTDLGDVYSIRGQNGTNTTVSVGAVSGGATTFAWNVDDYPLSGLADQAANTIVANVTGSSAAPTAFAIAANSFPARVGGNLVSHSFSTLAGSGLTYAGSGVLAVNAGDGIDVGASVSADVSDFAGAGLLDDGSNNLAVRGNTMGHIVVDGITGVAFRKSRQQEMWWEEFEYLPFGRAGGGGAGITTSGLTLTCGTTNWFLQASGASGNVANVAPEAAHPGIVRMTTGSNTSNAMILYRGVGDTGAVSTPSTLAQAIYAAEFIVRVSTVTSVLCDFGFADSLSTVANRIIFEFDTSSDTTIHTITEEADTQTNTDTNVAPGTGWNVYTILQETPGVVDFYIDDVLVTTHSTNVPDAEAVHMFARVLARSNSARTMDVDYVSYESQPLGARTA